MKYKACRKCAESVGTVNVIGNILMIAVKGYLGVTGRSKGLIADAIHSCADLLATIVMIIGLRVSGREKNAAYPYGFGKAEYIVAIIIYLFLFTAGVYIVSSGLAAIVAKQIHPPCLSAAWGAVFSIAINELMFRQSVCAGTQINSPSMVAKAWESRSDVYSSVAVLVGIIGAKMGFHFMDPLAAMIVGCIILKICVEMVWEAVSRLMDRSFEHDSVREISDALGRMESVSKVKQVFAREFGRYLEFEIDLYVPAETSVRAGEALKEEIRRFVNGKTGRRSIVKIRFFPG